MVEIRLEKLRKKFANLVAVKDVSLTFGDGEMTSVLGPSGCGKTTTLNLIAGFILPDSGTIQFGDRVIVDPQRGIALPTSKRELGMVFQSYALWPHLSIAENVGYGLKMRGVGRAERDAAVRRSLARVRLEKVIDRFPHELSGGQQQRVALARAIAYSPQILLFDEPLSNLDALLREEMREELKALHEEIGITAVYVTHDQSEAMSLSDTIIVMGEGEVLQRGTPRQLYEEPASSRVARFIGKTNLLNATLADCVDTHARVKIDGLPRPIECRSAKAVANSAGMVSIRPEAIRLTAAASDNSGIHARIVSATYLGDMCRYEVLFAGDCRLETLQSSQSVHSIGDDVSIEFDRERCYFIPGQESRQ